MTRSPLLLDAACLALALATAVPAQHDKKPRDDTRAHALYDKMIQTMRSASSLAFESRYRWSGEGGKEIGHCTYHCYLRKPNQFRIDTQRADGKKGGVLVGDGRYLWIHWPNGRPFFSSEDPKKHHEPRDKDYMRERTPLGRHSIAHKTSLLGAGMSMTILDPSTFHGYTDSLQPYLDGVTSKGTVWLEDEHGQEGECEILFASFMKGQRTWELWLSKKDGLPRFLKQVVHVSYDIVTEERWTNVRRDVELDDSLFRWRPPEGWKQWWLPALEDRLLKPGAQAPDFELAARDGDKIKLSGYRGKVVWLIFWRSG